MSSSQSFRSGIYMKFLIQGNGIIFLLWSHLQGLNWAWKIPKTIKKSMIQYWPCPANLLRSFHSIYVVSVVKIFVCWKSQVDLIKNLQKDPKCWKSELLKKNFSIIISVLICYIWDKLFKNGPSKICRRQPLKYLKGYGLLSSLPQILLGPF